ncbi:MAG: hypothetical protein WAU52_05975, partial [Burkholderiales bacterium]
MRIGFEHVLDLDDFPAEEPYARAQHAAHALAEAAGRRLHAHRDDGRIERGQVGEIGEHPVDPARWRIEHRIERGRIGRA